MVVLVALAFGVALGIIGLLFLDPILYALGSNEVLIGYCRSYAVPVIAILPFAVLGIITGAFLIAEGRPGLGSALSIAGGVVNIVLDYLFIVVLDMGIAGAAYATGIGYLVPAVVGLAFFAGNRRGSIRFVRPVLRPSALAKISGNGISEMTMMLSGSVSAIIMNNVMVRLAGADGVAAITIVVYSYAIISSAFYGYDYGVAPVASYNHGKGDLSKLSLFYRTCLKVTAVAAVAMFIVCLVFADPIVWVFVRPESPVHAMAVMGLRIVGVGFLAMGFNDFASSFFTSLNDGKTSGIIAFMRTFVFMIAFILALPAIGGVIGLWMAMPAAEFASLFISAYYLTSKKEVYRYGG